MFNKTEQKALPYRMVVFNEVVQAGSFTAAAERLGHTKSAVSSYISQLESLLGVKLLNRSTRRLHLTPAGQQFVKRSEQLVAIMQLAMDELGGFIEEPQGRLAMTAPHAFQELLVDSVIADLCQQYPKLLPDIQFTDERLDLLEHQLDLAITVGPLHDSNYYASKVGTLDSLLVASPMLLEKHSVLSLEALNNLPHIQLPWQQPTKLYADNGDVHTLSCERVIRLNTLPSAIIYACRGLGVLMAPSVFVLNHIHQGELAHILPKWQGAGREVHVVHRYGQHIPFVMRQVVERLRRKLSSFNGASKN